MQRRLKGVFSFRKKILFISLVIHSISHVSYFSPSFQGVYLPYENKPLDEEKLPLNVNGAMNGALIATIRFE